MEQEADIFLTVQTLISMRPCAISVFKQRERFICLTELSVFDVSGYREPICGLASEAVGSTDEGREHRVDRIISAGLWSHQFPCFQVYQRMVFRCSTLILLAVTNQFQ